MSGRDGYSFRKFATAVSTMGVCKGSLVCLILLAIGIVGAFARFLPQDKITERADSAGVQILSAVCFVLSGFALAIVAGLTKGRKSDASSGIGIDASKINKVGRGDWTFSPADRFAKVNIRPQHSFVQTDNASHQSGAVDIAEMNVLKFDNPHSEIGETEKVEFEVVDFRQVLVDKSFSNETRAFLEDRLEGLVIDSPMNEDQILEWGQRAASIIDEIALLRAHISYKDSRVVDIVCDCICDKMRDMDLAVIDKAIWDPSCQRAVSVVRSETAVETKILKKKACGLTFKGKVIKKQEVDVEMPFAQ